MKAGKRTGKKARYPNTLLVLGMGILVAGGLLLLWSHQRIPQLGGLWPVPVILAGLIMLYLAYLRGRSQRYIIPGMVLSLGGLVFLLQNTVLKQESLRRIWPAFMLVTGLSLIPYAFRRRGSARTAIIAPAIFIAALAILFFPFSLRASEGDFAAFVRQWWPMALVVLGIALIVSFFSTRKPNSKI